MPQNDGGPGALVGATEAGDIAERRSYPNSSAAAPAQDPALDLRQHEAAMAAFAAALARHPSLALVDLAAALGAEQDRIQALALLTRWTIAQRVLAALGVHPADLDRPPREPLAGAAALAATPIRGTA